MKKIEIEIESLLDSIAEMNETDQNEFIVEVAEQIKREKSYIRQELAARVLNALGITESDFREIGREEFGLYETGAERDTAANTNYKY